VKLTGEALGKVMSSGKLGAIYVLVGDDPLLVEEARDAIFEAARQAGYCEICRLDVENGFDWSELRAAAQSRSLFSNRKIIDLRMKAPRPGRDGARELTAYAEAPDADSIVVLSCREWEATANRAAWLGKLERAGGLVELRAVRPEHMGRWVQTRAQTMGLSLSRDALGYLVHRTEGNLLAARQELQKLLLIHGPGDISLQQVQGGSGDEARFDIFGLTDAMVAGKPTRVQRIIDSLHAENEPVVRLLWAVTREIRLIASVADKEPREAESLLGKSRVWPARRRAIMAAAKRRDPMQWQALLGTCSRADAVAKGQEPGDAWLLARSLACDAAYSGVLMSALA